MMWEPVHRPTDHVLRIAGLVALSLVLVACFVRFLLNFNYLPGTDAYYYALQTQSLLDTGQIKVPDHGALYYAMAAVSRSGLSIEAAFRITLAATFTIYQLGMLLLILRLKDESQPFAALLWTLSSPIVAFHAIEFPNLSLALATLPIWFWLAMKPVRRWWFWLALLLSASILVHPAAAVLAVLFAVTATLGRMWTGGAQPGKSPFKTSPWVLTTCTTLLLVISAIYAGHAGIGARLLSLRPGTPGMIGLVIKEDIPNEMKVTIVFAWLLLASFLFSYWKICAIQWRFLAVATLAIPLWPDHFTGLAGVGGRLAALFVLPALPLIVVIREESNESSRFFSWTRAARKQRLVAFAVVIAIAVLPMRVRAYRALLMSNDYPAYERVVAALGKSRIPMLIAHQGLDFFYSYRLRRDAFHFDPEPNWKRAEIWRVAVRITPEEAAYYSPPTCPWGTTADLIHGTAYVLMREDCWQQLRSRVNREDNPDLYSEIWENMENPSQPRPDFMRARHRDFGQHR
jgi:hypothetical protein